MLRKIFLFALIAGFLSIPEYSSAKAQGQGRPFYVVQDGDSLWQIAAGFGVTVENLMKENGLSDAGQISLGSKLFIPGLNGYDGEVTTTSIVFGDTLYSLSSSYAVPITTLARLNHLTTPGELFPGYSFVVPVLANSEPTSFKRADLHVGQSLLELAVLQGEDPWMLSQTNQLPGTWAGLPGGVLQISANVPQGAVQSGLPAMIDRVQVTPIFMLQGGTNVIRVTAPGGISMSGSLNDHVLNFFPDGDGYVALQGIHAMTEPGLYPLALQGRLADGTEFAFTQNVLIQNAAFAYDPSLTVDPVTVDPAVTGPETDLWTSLGVNATPEKMWNGLFVSPVPPQFTNCWPSLFGNRRSYNGGTYDFFHGGLDFCGTVGTELFASAAGRVTYTGPLTVRGNVVVVDHGWGIYTAYDHLSEILVNVGDAVQPGQLIGLGGATGRTTGPHLHWEVWVGGVQVNPADWLQNAYP
jgi:murein DD-endopeptidase MepM/ murein hydrolase activator NlpD